MHLKFWKHLQSSTGPGNIIKNHQEVLLRFRLFVCILLFCCFFSFVAVDCLLFVCFFWLVVVSLLLATAVRENDHLKHNLLWFGREWGVLFVSTQHLKNLTTLVAGVISDKWKRQREHLVHTLLYKKCIYIRQRSNWPFLLLFDDAVVVVVAIFYLLQIL